MITTKISSTYQSKLLQRKNFKEIMVNTNDIVLDSQRIVPSNLISAQSSSFYLANSYNQNQQPEDDKNPKVEMSNTQRKSIQKDKNCIIFNPQTTASFGCGSKNQSSPSSPIKNAFQTQIIQENLSHMITQSMLKTIRGNSPPKHDDLNQLIYTMNKPNKGQRDIIFLNEKINNKQHFFEFASIPEKHIQYFYDSIEYQFIPKGKALFELGQPADSMYLLLEGEAYYLIKSIGGNTWNQLKDANLLGKYLHLNIAKLVKKFDFIGDYDLMKKQRRQGTCLAKTDCHIVRIPRQVFECLTKRRLEQYYLYMTKFLISSHVFLDIRKNLLFNILSCFTFGEYRANQIIYLKDSNDSQLYIVVSGHVQIQQEEEEEGYNSEVEERGEINYQTFDVFDQQYFGEESIFGLQKQYNIKCLQDSTLVIKIDKNKLENLIQESIPAFHQRISYYSAINRAKKQRFNTQSKQQTQQTQYSENQQDSLNLNILRRPLSSIGDYTQLASARSSYTNNRLNRNLRSLSQCQDREDQYNTHRASNLDKQQPFNHNHQLINQRVASQQSQYDSNPSYHQSNIKINPNTRRFSYQVEDLSQFDDKEIKENFENSSLFQMYQHKKKKLFQRANNFIIQENMNEFQSSVSQDAKLYNTIDVPLRHKIKQFQSLFGHSPQKNKILLKQKQNPIKFPQNYDQNHQNKFLSLSVEDSMNNIHNNEPVDFYLQPLRPLQQNQQKTIGISPNTSQQLSTTNTNNFILNSSRSRNLSNKNPVYCTIYKEKLQQLNNSKYFQNVKIEIKNQPPLPYQILSKICK